jgi:hypothetical protein
MPILLDISYESYASLIPFSRIGLDLNKGEGGPWRGTLL